MAGNGFDYLLKCQAVVDFLRDEYGVEPRLAQDREHKCGWTPYMGGPTVYLTAADAALIPA